MCAVIRGSRSESTRAKVAIMKLKLKAEGMESIPQVRTTEEWDTLHLILLIWPLINCLLKFLCTIET